MDTDRFDMGNLCGCWSGRKRRCARIHGPERSCDLTHKRISRRRFIKKASCALAAVTAPTVIPASALGLGRHVAPSNRIATASKRGCPGSRSCRAVSKSNRSSKQEEANQASARCHTPAGGESLPGRRQNETDKKRLVSGRIDGRAGSPGAHCGSRGCGIIDSADGGAYSGPLYRQGQA